MGRSQLIVDAQRAMDDAVSKVNRLARDLVGSARGFMEKAPGKLAAEDPNEVARTATDLVLAHAELVQAKLEYETARRG